MNPRLTCVICYIPQPDWSFLLLVNVQGTEFTHSTVYTKHDLQLPVYETETTTSFQHVTHLLATIETRAFVAATYCTGISLTS